MINLFDKWDQAARNFKLAQLIAQLNIPTVVIDDDGFLPREIQSPMQYYCSHTNDGMESPCILIRFRYRGFGASSATAMALRFMI